MNKAAKVLIGGGAGLLLAITTLFVPSYSSTYGINDKNDDTSERAPTLIEYVVFDVDCDESFTSLKWASVAQDDIRDLRNSDVFMCANDASDSEKAKVQDAKDLASAFFYAYHATKQKSPVPKGMTGDWGKVKDSFYSTASGLVLTSEEKEEKTFKIASGASCWTEFEQAFGITISSSIKKVASTVYNEIKHSSYNVSSSGNLLDDYPEDTQLASGSSEAIAFWNQIQSDYNSATNKFTGYWGHADWRQCTTFASWRLWKATNGTHGTAGGDGKNVATNLVNAYPNEYELSTTPKAGAIFSVYKGSKNAGHVGYIEKVEGDYLWFSDGNIAIGVGNSTGGASDSGIRINKKCKISEFVHLFKGGQSITYANPK